MTCGGKLRRGWTAESRLRFVPLLVVPAGASFEANVPHARTAALTLAWARGCARQTAPLRSAGASSYRAAVAASLLTLAPTPRRADLPVAKTVETLASCSNCSALFKDSMHSAQCARMTAKRYHPSKVLLDHLLEKELNLTDNLQQSK